MKKLPKKFHNFKPHGQRLKDGDIIDTVGMAQIAGYTPERVRQILRHHPELAERRGRAYYFTPELAEGFMVYISQSCRV